MMTELAAVLLRTQERMAKSASPETLDSRLRGNTRKGTDVGRAAGR